MPRFIAAIDQGTTSTRCMILDRDGPVAAAQKEHRQIFPRPGWVEHDPLEILRKTEQVIAEAVVQAGAQPGDIAAIGIANQRETTVVWDRNTGQPLCNAIVWQDTRTKPICDELATHGGIDRFRATTGLPLATYFSGPKLRWILENDPSIRQAAQRGDALFGTVDSWLIWNLTGAARGGHHVTDVTNASRTLLMNLATLRWDDAMIDHLRIDPKMLPRITPSIDPAGWGRTIPNGPFGDSIPVCGNLGDQQAALFGQCCFEPGESKNTYGTGCFLLVNTGTSPVVSTRGMITTVASQKSGEPARYALEGSIAVAGSLVQWLRDNLAMIRDSAEIESVASGVPDSGGIYIVPAFSGLFAPYWRSDARGLVAGLTGFTNRHHLARAVLEAVAFQTRDVVDAMTADSATPLTRMKVDGGMTVNNLLMQFQADLLGVPVIRSKVRETTALGAAYAAGLAIGFWRDLDDLRSKWHADQTWEPTMSESDRQHRLAGWHKAVQRAMGWV
ncbi:MAG TPA: glycerol kinase GlpK [Tepidisphaeraceae bacterium]|jgi:glycerol kinase|nr:glycerol kinase GlpK [Tepidisphaeraceae bacterium]